MFAIDLNEWELANLLEETREKRLAEIRGTKECAAASDRSGLMNRTA